MRKIILKKMVQEAVKFVKNSTKRDRWTNDYDPELNYTKTERQYRGDLIRFIKAIEPNFQGAETLSLYCLEDAKMATEKLQVQRLSWTIQQGCAVIGKQQ